MSQTQSETLYRKCSIVENQQTGEKTVVPGETEENYWEIHTPTEDNDVDRVRRDNYRRLELVELPTSVSEARLFDWVEDNIDQIKARFE